MGGPDGGTRACTLVLAGNGDVRSVCAGRALVSFQI